MKPDEAQNEKLFSAMMKSSRLEMPFDDFEDRVMLHLQQETALENSTSVYRKWSVVFFVVGIGLGLFINNFLSLYQTIAGIPSQSVLLAFRIAFVLIILKQLDNLLGLFSKSKIQNSL